MRVTSLNVLNIRKLRSKGFSVPEISKKLNIPKSTVFRYVQGIEIMPEFKDMWLRKRGGSSKK